MGRLRRKGSVVVMDEEDGRKEDEKCVSVCVSWTGLLDKRLWGNWVNGGEINSSARVSQIEGLREMGVEERDGIKN